MAITDIITKPIGGTIKGMFAGGLGFGAVGGLTGGLGGAAVGGLISTAVAGLLFLTPVGWLLGGVSLLGAAGIVAAGVIGGGLFGAAVGAVPSAIGGTAVGGTIGGVIGVFKGIIGVFSGKTKETVQNEKELQAMRQQAATEEAALRQQQRANALNGLDNSAAVGGNVARLQAEAPGQSISR